MLLDTHVERMRAERGTRHLIVGTLRKGEYDARYAATPAEAERLEAQMLADGRRLVRVIPAADVADEATLRDLGRAWRDARDAERAAADAAKAAVVAAAEAGTPETTLADWVGVDRMTIRRALGKLA